MRFVCFCFFHAGVPKVRDDMEVTAAEDKASTDLVLQSTEVIHVPYLITSGANTIKHFFFFSLHHYDFETTLQYRTLLNVFLL